MTGNAILEAARGKIGRRAFSAPLLGDMIEEAVFERLQSPRKTRRALEVKLISVSDSADRPSGSIRPSTTKPFYRVMGLAEAFKRFFRTTSAREDQTQRNRIAHQAFLPMESCGLPIGLDHVMIASVTSQTVKNLVDLKPRDNPVELFANTLLLEHLGLTQATIPMAHLKTFGYPSGPDIGVDLEAEVGGKRVLARLWPSTRHSKRLRLGR